MEAPSPSLGTLPANVTCYDRRGDMLRSLWRDRDTPCTELGPGGTLWCQARAPLLPAQQRLPTASICLSRTPIPLPHIPPVSVTGAGHVEDPLHLIKAFIQVITDNHVFSSLVQAPAKLVLRTAMQNALFPVVFLNKEAQFVLT